MRNKVLENWNGGVPVGGKRIMNLRYVDDTVIPTSEEAKMEVIMANLTEESSSYRLEINRAKTKIMIIDRQNENQSQGHTVAGFAVVESFNYLRSVVTNKGESEEEG